ncbi:hypothetical protein [Sphingomonas panacis]|nr:hypothetical protein [Sphingomonas panacis]
MMPPFGAALLATMVPAAAIIAVVAVIAHVATAMIHAVLAARCVRSGVHLR